MQVVPNHINPLHADPSSEDKSIFNDFFTKFKIWNFYCHDFGIQHQHDQCTEISTDKPSIGPVVLQAITRMFSFQFFKTKTPAWNSLGRFEEAAVMMEETLIR